jgi:Pyruvate/2-oxoacid:ferredoxin oxidoreductase gamma subunit
VYICLEPVEALRRGIYASEKTTFLLNDRTIPGVMITADLEQYPSLDKIESTLKGYSEEIYFINATQLALDNFDQNQQLNIIMLGFAIASGKLPFIKVKHYEEVIDEWLRDPEINKQALHIGIEQGNQIIVK